MQNSFYSKKIIKFLSIFALLLIFINILMLFIYFYINNPQKFNFIQLIDLDMEQNIPTLFSSLLFSFNSFLFYLLSKVKNKSNYWYGLSLIFLFLAFDESAKIHEYIGDFTENYVDASGFLYYPWFISYSILLIILSIIYANFFLQMNKKILYSFILCAFMFCTGAIGFDILGGYEADLNGNDTIKYCILYTIEESLEMFGLIYLSSILLGLLEGIKIEIKNIG